MEDYRVIETPEKKHQVKIRTYLTGADEDALQQVILESTKTTIDGNGNQVTEIDATLANRQKRLKIDRFVMEVDGSTENVVTRVYEMRRADFNSVFDALNKVTAPLDEESGKKTRESKKNASPSNTTS